MLVPLYRMSLTIVLRVEDNESAIWIVCSLAAEAIVLAFQHYLTMVGTAVLIPLLIFRADTGGTPVSTDTSSSLHVM